MVCGAGSPECLGTGSRRRLSQLRRRQRRPGRGRSPARPRWACMAADRGRQSAPKTEGMTSLWRGDIMKATRTLHDLGQSLWLDNITRNMLRTGVLRRYIDEFSVTGLTSNPTIFDHAIKN